MATSIGPFQPTGIPGLATAVLEQAAEILRNASSVGVPNLRHAADEVVDIAETQPAHAADLLEAMKPSLSAGESDQLTREMVQSAQAKTAQPKDTSRNGTTLALDTAQLALSVAGIFDPTPTCDAIDGVISLLRGDYAGAAISALSMVPYVGDLAKLGKLNKLAGVAADAADVAKALPGGDTARLVSTGAVTPSRNALPTDFVDGPPAGAEKVVFRDADHLLSHFGLQRIADHPEHAALWRTAHDAVSKPGNNNAYTRAMDKLAAGETLTSEDARGAFGTVRKQFRDLFEARYGFRPADVEHVINLALQPKLALDPRNLSVTPSERELGTKVHELLHWIKSGGDSVNDSRVWWLQIYADATGRFNAMTKDDVEQAVRELLEQYRVKEPS